MVGFQKLFILFWRYHGAMTARTSGTTRTGATEAREFQATLKGVLATVPATSRESFVRTVRGTGADGLEADLWGRGPSAAESRAAGLENLRRQFEARARAIEASADRGTAAELLGISEQAVLNRLEVGDLIALRKGRGWRFPLWQFNPDTERGHLPGIAGLRVAFPGGPVSLTEWATRPNPELNGATPAGALAAGRVDEVVEAARLGTAAAW